MVKNPYLDYNCLDKVFQLPCRSFIFHYEIGNWHFPAVSYASHHEKKHFGAGVVTSSQPTEVHQT